MAATFSGRQYVRVAVIGDTKTFKSSFISFSQSKSFPEKVVDVLPPTEIPAENLPDATPLLLIDKSSRHEDNVTLICECLAADVILVTFACQRRATLETVTRTWLLLLRTAGVTVPILLVRCQLDQRPATSPSLDEHMLPVMGQFPEVDTAVDCSSRGYLHVNDVLLCAQKAVLHPSDPLFELQTRVLPPFSPVHTVHTVRIVEVGPRDGLQSEHRVLSTEVKVAFIGMLVEAGLKEIEATSFVPAWKVPQLADASAVMQEVGKRQAQWQPTAAGIPRFVVLTPNLKGLQAAIQSGARTVAVFASASEAFSEANLNSSIATSLERYARVCATALEAGLRVRGYVSCVLGCPYEGHVSPSAVLHVVRRLLDMGCYEVSLGDTIGGGTEDSVSCLLDHLLLEGIPVDRLAVHFHDADGRALLNILVALQKGVSVVDSSVAGLGGCPYAGKCVPGNVPSEDVVFMLHKMGIRTGVDLCKLMDVGSFICDHLGTKPRSQLASRSTRLQLPWKGRL